MRHVNKASRERQLSRCRTRVSQGSGRRVVRMTRLHVAPRGKLLPVAVDNWGKVILGTTSRGALAMLHTIGANNGLEVRENKTCVMRARGASCTGFTASRCCKKVTDLHVLKFGVC